MKSLVIKNLCKTYKNRQIVKNINLYITSGEIVGLLGSNGSGKTTTFYMILGIVPHDSGYILLNNKSIEKLPIYSRARLGIGYLPQENSIFRQLTVFDNLMAIAQFQSFSNKKNRDKYVLSLMHDFHIYHLKNNFGQVLSGGERKRVEIARALITNPKFVLFDEPFSGVDPISITDIQKIIRKLKSYDIGVLITDHNVKATLSLCSRVYIINHGKLIAHGSPKDLINNKYACKAYLSDF